jgi:hypothetical protein
VSSLIARFKTKIHDGGTIESKFRRTWHVYDHVFEGAEYDCPTDLGLNIGRMVRQLEVEMSQTVDY